MFMLGSNWLQHGQFFSAFRRWDSFLARQGKPLVSHCFVGYSLLRHWQEPGISQPRDPLAADPRRRLVGGQCLLQGAVSRLQVWLLVVAGLRPVSSRAMAAAVASHHLSRLAIAPRNSCGTDITSSLTVSVVGRTETGNWSMLSIGTVIVVLRWAERAGLDPAHTPVRWAQMSGWWLLCCDKSSHIRPDCFIQVGAMNPRSDSCLRSSIVW